MPGQPNTCSTTTEPPMMWGMCPSTVVSTAVTSHFRVPAMRLSPSLPTAAWATQAAM